MSTIVGFRPEERPTPEMPTQHYGLAYLKERIETVGGKLWVTSRPGAGTTLEAHLPLLTESQLVASLSHPSR